MTDSLFDSQRFLQSLAGDKELAQELLAAFMEDSPERASSLKEALDSGDAEEASKLAHSLKGMCGVVRAEPLVNLAISMEHGSKNGDLNKIKEQFDNFSKLLDAAHDEMRQFMSAD